MKQETRILELVEKGAITPEQAQELLETLQASRDTSTPESEYPFAMPVPPVPPMPPVPPLPPMPRVPNAKSGRPLSNNAGAFTFEQIVQMGQMGIKPDYVTELRAAGLEQLTFQQVVELRMN